MGKRKFGVSVDTELARRLDELARTMEVERSALVEMALEELLSSMLHLGEDHECLAMIAVSCPEGSEPVRLPESPAVRATQLHEHRNGRCLQLFLVSGRSGEIARLYSELRKGDGCVARVSVLH